MIPQVSSHLSVYSVTLLGTESTPAIPLRDPETLGWLAGLPEFWPAGLPEWTAAGRQVVGAVVGGGQARLSVVFQLPVALFGSAIPPVQARISARGNDYSVTPVATTLSFDAQGLSAPQPFYIATPFPVGPGRVQFTLEWFALAAGDTEAAIGTTSHDVLLAWRAPRPAAEWARWSDTQTGKGDGPEAPYPWVYRSVMEWTSTWAEGATDEKQICDAILAHLPESGLQYAVPAYSVGDILSRKGGYCGGFYRLFQAMASAQGIRIERRSVLVDWRTQGDEARWTTMVVSNPGLNQSECIEPPSTFHDVDRGPMDASPVTERTERRFRFWGQPGAAVDGHCINLLPFGGRWYLYDACFLQTSVELDGFTIPEAAVTRSVPVGQLGTFKSAYLDKAVSYMMGSLRDAGKLYTAAHPDDENAHWINGLTVSTPVIPGAADELTFRWGL